MAETFEVRVQYTVAYVVFVEGTRADAERFAEQAPSVLPDEDFDAAVLAATQAADVIVADTWEPDWSDPHVVIDGPFEG